MYSFQNITQFSQGTNVQDAAASNMDGFLSRDMCFLNISEYAYSKQKQPITTLKHLSCGKYSFQTLT
jgi:hypothetical protein